MCCILKKVFLSFILLSLCTCALMQGDGASVGQLDVEVRNSPKVYMDPELEKASQAMFHYLVGNLSYADEDFSGAIENFQMASDLTKESTPKLNAKLAELYVRGAELEKGLGEIEKALAGDPENSSYLLLYAGILESLQRSEDAKPVYHKLIEKEPALIEPYVLLSNLYIKEGKAQKGVELLIKLSKEASDEMAVHYYLGKGYEIIEELDKAQEHLTKAYESKGYNEEVATELIRVLIKNNKRKELEKLCTEILNIDTTNLIARRILGELAIGDKRFDEALEHLQVLGNIEEDPSTTRFKMALIHIEKQNFKEAIRELLLVLATDPQNSKARYYLASIYAGKGRNNEAIDELLKIEVEQEMYLKSRTFLAFLLRKEAKLDKAEQVLEEALAIEKKDSKLLAYLIVILRESKKYKKAADILHAAVERDPKNEKLLYSYGLVKYDLAKVDESIELMEQVIALDSKHVDALNFVAYTLAEENKNLDRAESLINIALKERPEDGYLLDTLGWIYYKQERYEEAEEVLGRAVIITGGDVVITEHHGDALVKLKKISEALAVYQKALEYGKKLLNKNKEELRSIEKTIPEKLKTLKSEYPELNVQLSKP